MRWLVGFVFYKVAFGLLSVLLPLYITQTSQGNVVVWGVFTATATFLAIPFAFLWGYLCDATQRYRLFILLSFASVTVFLYAFTLTTNLFTLGILYTLIIVFEVAHEPSKNVLIAETYSHSEWKRGFATYEAWTELGWVIGLLLGFVFAILNLGNTIMLLISVFFNFVAFLASAILVMDPALIFERSLVSMEKSISVVQKGAVLLSKADTEPDALSEFKQENASALCIGLVLFALATSTFFTPLPMFFEKSLALQTSAIFILFMLNSASCLLGDVLVQRKTDLLLGSQSIKRIALLRGGLVFLPILAAVTSFYGALALSITVLVGTGLVFAFYSISVLSLSMEVIPQGKAGLFSALVGTGSAIGCLIGPLIAGNLGFQYTFITSTACFLLSFVAFKNFE
jgi:MFS family permease